MKFVITGKNIEVTEALRDKIHDKVGKLEKFFHRETEVHATMSVQKNNHMVEVTIPFNRVVFKAAETNDDMYASIDKVVDSLERQIVKNKAKLVRKGADSKYKAQDYMWEPTKEDDPELRVVKTKVSAVKPMSVEEAVMQLNILGQDFFMFKNSESNCVNVIYKRNDGHFGLIEPED